MMLIMDEFGYIQLLIEVFKMNTCKQCRFFDSNNCHALPPVRTSHSSARPYVYDTDVACLYFKSIPVKPVNEVKK